ncbi:hypothetical protein BAZSYMA_ACONTIG19398_2 [Bathymodiolus azoricus thioautotrophic gill symbiont]|uniref:Uncharacterized protein n=1 Tax=Bathymodiolus azoricus thioautotrophic gill symbiont TaxID=235205 RepID=A0A1H6KD44_9GAMM|nr:hypothetical protein BAZSYMA_ACONTIG19398_2 [Bathymodiolus azoricus thioautotrophic gill symbiont]
MILKIVVSGMNNFYLIFSSWRYYVKYYICPAVALK